MVKVIFDKVLGVVREDRWEDYINSDGFDYTFNFDLDAGGQIFYLGGEETDGSWRIIDLGDGKFTIQRLVLGSWNTKAFFDNDGLTVSDAVNAYGERDLLRYMFMVSKG